LGNEALAEDDVLGVERLGIDALAEIVRGGFWVGGAALR